MSVVADEHSENVDLYDFDVETPPDGRAWVAMAAAALLFDAAARQGPATAATALFLAALSIAVVFVSRTRSRDARLLAGAAIAFSALAVLRTSPWVIGPATAGAIGCTTLAASLTRTGRFYELTGPRLALRAAHAFVHGVFAIGYVRAGLPKRAGGRRLDGLWRGVVLAAPLVVVLGVLLASADAVFASFFRLPAIGDATTHAVFLGCGLLLMAALLRTASVAPMPGVGEPPRFLGATEALTVLASMVALYGLFAVAQLVTLAGGARHVLETQGLTYAEYARSGFFQLLAVAAITLFVLLGVRTVTDLSDLATHRRFVALAELAVALTLVIVIVALRRLALYDDAFGLTMLRLAATVFAWWLGAIFVAVGVHLAGFLRSVVPVAIVLAGATVIGWGVWNPEAYVVRHNLAGAGDYPLDVAYLASLSDDAFPELATALPIEPEVRRRACEVEADSGGLRFNSARRRASSAADGLCPTQAVGTETHWEEVPPGS